MPRYTNSTAIFLAVSLLAGPVLGADDDNLVFIDQVGKDNSGQINQVGILNQIGTGTDPALQDGFFNNLVVNQTGDGNLVGTHGAGLNQNGQSATSAVFNQITINQQSNRNIVGEVQQFALGAIPDGANVLDITQNGGDENRIDTVIQEQSDGMPGQIATLIQTGIGNFIARVEQLSLTPAINNENSIRAEFIGDGNGTVGLSGVAMDAGARSGELTQTIGANGLGANGNFMDLLVKGDLNRFGIFQGGQLNSVGLITIEGSHNQIGVRQDGMGNVFTNSVIHGDGNIAGFEQVGTNNNAYLDMPGPGDDNQVSAFQQGSNDLEILVDGSRNVAIVKQDYDGGLRGDNFADLDLVGSDNFVDLVQLGSNTATIRYDGDRNNLASFGWAPLVSTGLEAGTFSQTGERNRIDAETNGEDNMFAARQAGDENVLTVFVTGAFNQAVVMQTGSDNTTWLIQSGNGNLALISQ